MKTWIARAGMTAAVGLLSSAVEADPVCDFVYPANGKIAPVPAGTAAGHGIDIAGPAGQHIIASRLGVATDHVIGSGVNLVIVAHTSGYRTYYRGNIRFVRKGAVARGTVIADKGTSNLRFEIRRFGAALVVPGKPGAGVVRGAKIPYDYPGINPATIYANPLRDVRGLGGLRQDMGVDYDGQGPVYAVGPGVIKVYNTHSGRPGGAYIAYELTDGAARGKTIYFAENLTLSRNLHVGSKVDAVTVIATLHSSFPHCETGWAERSGYSPLALSTGGYREGQRTAAGDNFDKFMRALGAPNGLTEGRSIVGHLPSSYPSRWKGKV